MQLHTAVSFAAGYSLRYLQPTQAPPLPQATALRELREETGYTAARVLGTGGRQYLSPGLTNENIVTVFVEVRRRLQSLSALDSQAALGRAGFCEEVDWQPGGRARALACSCKLAQP